ncbi:hypothetical protein GpartN1_g1323.t1 [Galdieria partita]|uniref:Galactose-1-phosphate uridylyltransferase n=1 Tax=Galdieria partita TaxID=83374 RepID=A0A9C7UNN4_9RHOD|nr:hypothetical protein GpartN1_g1323.t1 [Galdieria partita]
MSSKFDFTEHPHRRHNPLTNRSVLVSPHRAQRPWQGQVEPASEEKKPTYDPNCYLCPGNSRAGGKQNPKYEETFVFTNDFAALLPDTPSFQQQDESDLALLKVEGVKGTCKVICFSPRHDWTVAEMSVDSLVGVVRTWTEQHRLLAETDFINHVQIFENKGQAMGCSNPHPHCQIWATEFVPTEPAVEFENMRIYMQKKRSNLLVDYLAVELKAQERIVCENSYFVALVPFWAEWPFETLVLPRTCSPSLQDLDSNQQHALADIYRRVTCRYDNLFSCSFPYSMGLRQPPTDRKDSYEYCQLNMRFYPPLLRSATVRKFMVGFEMLGEPQRDITPEQAAERLRQCSEIHYKHQN